MASASVSFSSAARIVSTAKLPTRFGEFRIVAFSFEGDPRDHVALVRGDVRGAQDVPVRIHSECLTGDALGSLRCDCRDQLEQSLKHLAQQPRAILLYLRQEGRGIGLVNKVRAYQLQDEGLDTYEANVRLGFPADARDFGVAAQMLKALGVASVHLMSNNPQKRRALEARGITVRRRIPVLVEPTAHSAQYLETKRTKGGQMLPLRLRPSTS